jgi:hypothetical protein
MLHQFEFNQTLMQHPFQLSSTSTGKTSEPLEVHFNFQARGFILGKPSDDFV